MKRLHLLPVCQKRDVPSECLMPKTGIRISPSPRQGMLYGERVWPGAPSNLPPVIFYDQQILKHHICLLERLPRPQEVPYSAASLLLIPPFATTLLASLRNLRSKPAPQ